ncbi:hypothetical protein HY085_02370 [Candidatus Gottesmanbacteria bacterium]|nr:hypothetical protein [Candidatus Gottesmanbacteria bacterium]
MPDFFLNSKATARDRIANNKCQVNTKNLSLLGLSEAIGTIKTVPNQPADKLTNKSDKMAVRRGLMIIN